ncbi:MAG: sigma-70 family RNA polymerase sigma factor [Planctomycetales bacterium]|nr:sigma-70 family RNA polymerase sigma factor [Planctomycetales bacterium]
MNPEDPLPENESEPAARADSVWVRQFATTRWSLVVEAYQEPSRESNRAIGELAEQYWYPLYAFARRRGASREDAQDLTQGFLARLIESPRVFADANPERGRFRAFLITCFKHFVGQQLERDRAQRRGGGAKLLSLNLNFDEGERIFAFEPATHETPERLFQRRWALTLLATVLRRLGDEYREKGREEFFESTRGFLTADGSENSQTELAEQLGMSPGNLRVAIHRLRTRYRHLLREEVAHTVADPGEIDDELCALRAAIAAP